MGGAPSITIDDLAFPAIYLGYGISYIERVEQLRYVNENTLGSFLHPMWSGSENGRAARQGEWWLGPKRSRPFGMGDCPQFLFDRNGRWYRAVDASFKGKAPFPRRYQKEISFLLEECEIPVTYEDLYRDIARWFQGTQVGFERARAMVRSHIPVDHGETVPMETLRLPALHTNLSYFRVADDREQASFMSDWALPAKRVGANDEVPDYFWDASEQWYQAVRIEPLRKAPLKKRFFGWDSLIVAKYELKKVDAPISPQALYRDLSRNVAGSQSGEELKRAKKALKACQASVEICNWMLKYLDRPRF